MDNKKDKCGWITSTYWINFTKREEAIKGDEKRVYAKTKEYDLLELLYDNRERMLDYDCIAKKIWYGLDSTSNSNINKVICNLRKIIKDEKKVEIIYILEIVEMPMPYIHINQTIILIILIYLKL